MLVSINKNHMKSIFEPPFNYTETWKEMVRCWDGRFAVFHEGKRWLSGRNPLFTREITAMDQMEFVKYILLMSAALDRPLLETTLRNGGVFTMALGQRASRILDTESASIAYARTHDNDLYVIIPGKNPLTITENILPVLDHALMTHKMEAITFLVLEKLEECSWLPSSVWVYPGSAGIHNLGREDGREIVYQSSLFGPWKRKIAPISKFGVRHRTQHPYVDDLGFLWIPIFLFRAIPLLWITMSLTQAAERKINDPHGRKIFHDLLETVNKKAVSLKFAPLPFMASYSEGAYDFNAVKDVLRFRYGERIDNIPLLIVRDTTLVQISRYIRTNDLIFRTQHAGEFLVAPYQMSLEQMENLILPRLISHNFHVLPPFYAGDITSVKI